MCADSKAVPDEPMLREACGNMALALSVGLTSYGDAMNWLAHYIATESDDALEQLAGFARGVGLDLIAMTRIADVLQPAWRTAAPELDLRPALPLATALGESYMLLLAVDSPDLADRLPVVSMDRTRELFTPSVREWMSHHVEEIPQFTPSDQNEL